MSKRRISKQQHKRIADLQTKRRADVDKSCGESSKGQVVTHHGKYADVKHGQTIYHCKLRQNLGALVVGDNVIFQLNEKKEAVVTAIEPRVTKFWRMDERQQEKLIAANVDQVFIVMAPVPEPSWLLLDSYLAAIHYLNLPATIIFNKADLSGQGFSEKLALYEKLSVPHIKTSVPKEIGLDLLKESMQNKSSIFVGQSGVGKSSLIQKLLPQENLAVGDLHGSTGLGTHTTSSSILYDIESGGQLIDSPGIRDFSLWKLTPLELSKAFVDFEAYIGQCKFRDCTHLHEPYCAIQTAVADGKIAPSRLENYHALLERFKE